MNFLVSFVSLHLLHHVLLLRLLLFLLLLLLLWNENIKIRVGRLQSNKFV